MSLNLFFHALWTLSALGCIVCAADTRRTRDAGLFAAAFAVSAWWFRLERPPDPVWIGFMTAAVAGHRLTWPQRTSVLAVAGGVLAGVCAALMTFEGVPTPAAIVIVTMLAAATMVLARRRASFAPAALREEAALALLIIGLGVAMAPGVVTGWGAAQALNLPDRNAAAPMVPTWVTAVGAGAIFLGGAHRLWRR